MGLLHPISCVPKGAEITHHDHDNMKTGPEFSVIIPAFNEQSRLEPTVRDVASYFARVERPVEIIVVDDGSRDGTSALVTRLARELKDVRLIRLPANRGKGHAVRTGVVNSSGRLVLFADADGATPIEEVTRLEAALDEGSDIAIGSRVSHQKDVKVTAKLHRRVIGRAFHLLVGLLTVRGFDDTQCGFKLFTANAAHHLFSRMRMDGFSFDVELLMMAKRQGFQVAEVPVNWTHQPGSRVNLVLDSFGMARDLFAIRGHLVRGNYDEPQLAPMSNASAPEKAELLVPSSE